MADAFDWVRPSPLWGADAAEMARPDFFRPEIFEFASDDFVPEFLAAATAAPATALRAARLGPGAERDRPRLFQPVHGRFYLAGASLVCRLPGFPDRAIARPQGERVAFVLRKLVGPADDAGRAAAVVEYAWVASGPSKGWRPVAGRADRLLPGEELLAAFPVTAADGRTLHAAYLPVTSRETYLAPPGESPLAEVDPRPAELAGVLASLRRLLHDGDPQPIHASSPILLELALFLERHAPSVLAALPDGAPAPPAANAQALVTYLRGKTQTPATSPPTTLARAIADAAARRGQVEALSPDQPSPLPYNLRMFGLAPDVPANLPGAFEEALASGLPPWNPETQAARVEVGKFAGQRGDRYAVRPVYRRPQCEPPQAWVGRPSAPFEVAPLFDPGAPVRQIRIGLPEDVSVAGLRKFAKGVAFGVSRQLQERMNRVTPGMLAGDDPAPHRPDLGFLCTLSIPIITICAFILLIVIASLLDLVFRWLPFFQVCLPLKPSARS
jgi:hypothetical protein